MDQVKQHVKIINQLFEIEKKLMSLSGGESSRRNIDRIKNHFEEMGYYIHNPLNEPYNETRTDCEASIAGTSVENLFIQDVIKPVIRYNHDNQPVVVQKAVVIVKTRD